MPIPPPINKPCLLWGIDCVGVGMFGLFIICSLSFTLTLLISKAKKQRENIEVSYNGKFLSFKPIPNLSNFN